MGGSEQVLTAELIVDGAVPRNPVISPDGRWVAYSVAPLGQAEPTVSALWVAGADGAAAPRKLTDVAAHDRLSPISYASKVSTPVLILHGEDDTNVPLVQAVYFQRALSRYGAEHELVVYPREGHGTRERNHQLDQLRRTRAWFDRWLTGPVSGEDPA